MEYLFRNWRLGILGEISCLIQISFIFELFSFSWMIEKLEMMVDGNYKYFFRFCFPSPPTPSPHISICSSF